MERVVYVIGAGFSAQFGLPVVSNFLQIARDLYGKDAEKYSHFANVFDKIDQMAKALRFYKSDHTNIEEILSLLEMENALVGDSFKTDFIQFIIDVIKASTPDIKISDSVGRLPLNDFSFHSGNLWPHGYINSYGMFISALLNVEFGSSPRSNHRRLLTTQRKFSSMHYSVISMNYDTIIEKFATRLFEYSDQSRNFIQRPSQIEVIDDNFFSMAKLHGSIDEINSIIAPTFNKTFVKDHVAKEWGLAYDLLSKANYIRVLGYSLPDSDSYMKYLFKTSVLRCKNLKAFDVVCIDKDGTTRSRYQNLLNFSGFNYLDQPIEIYLKNVVKEDTGPNKPTRYNITS